MSASNVRAAAFRSAAFQVCEGLVDRVEVGAVGGQVAQRRAG
jgi:hypothetical protein